ncbi:MAG: biotin/lipoyl-binding protein, partial [Cyanothece sp. SIO1E1]|nr:biotin/lipoyl-binding protein [Cyanothece sp. SIO1E1]
MSDPSTLLLLACTHCLDNAPVTEVPVSQCNSIERKVSQADAPAQAGCVSSPETLEVALAANPAAAASEPGDLPSSDTQVLKTGSQGEAVTKLQTQLEQLGHYQGSIDGRFGQLTKVAVQQFQQAAQLQADGVVGSITWAALQSDAATTDTPAPAASQPHESSIPFIDSSSSDASVSDAQTSTFVEAVASNVESREAAALVATESISSQPQIDQSESVDSRSTLLEQLDVDPAFVKAYLLWPLGGLVAFSAVGGLVLFLKNHGILNRQLEFQGEAGIPANSSFQSDSAALGSLAPHQVPKDLGGFDQPVVLTQSGVWSRTIVWSIVGLTAFALVFAALAKVDEAVPAQGKLEPKAAVKDVQAPVGGVVKQIHIEEGDQVEQGDLLISFDPTAAAAELKSLQEIRESLIQENQFYRTQMGTPSAEGFRHSGLKIAPGLASLTQNRVSLATENQLYRAELNGQSTGINLSAAQQERLLAIKAEKDSRVAAARLEVAQLTQQLEQNRVQLANAKK